MSTRRALLSVFDKAGVVELAAGLAELVADLTGYPAMLGHRVVTLHPLVHGGILADRDDASHRADVETYGIPLIDLVVANLYPFGTDPSVELIDIGGPAMVRAAAKNHAHVGVVVDPADYAAVLVELRSGGDLSSATRRRLARKAFSHTAGYDAAIVDWLDAL
ncbi:MAG: bifunctional phosphoribosylaminoimidazolecarboxamide formyltransferase/IMP cyclohydrolase PurH, partial [Acidimicrobiales bacterium]|nr:bifunctional phosphoribosylaminoimidazolecarboxamide formyltransferase/IMP cyclohydrolase PurH [Acidimicrobiales bacterium]